LKTWKSATRALGDGRGQHDDRLHARLVLGGPPQSQDAAEIVHEQMERLERQLVEERVKVALIRGSVQPAVSGVYGLRPTPAANRES